MAEERAALATVTALSPRWIAPYVERSGLRFGVRHVDRIAGRHEALEVTGANTGPPRIEIPGEVRRGGAEIERDHHAGDRHDRHQAS